MKSPVTAIEIRWRIVGDDAWMIRRYPVGTPVTLRDLERDEDYEVEARNIGVGDLASAWVAATITVPATNLTGALALPPNVVTNQSSMWGMDTEVTYAAESPLSGDSEATISMSAGTLVVGEVDISYDASSAAVTGAPSSSRVVYLYYDDPRLEGGARELGVSDTPVGAANVYGRVAITPVLLQFPGPGDTGGGGGGIGGGGGGGGPHTPQQPQLPL